MVLSLSHGWSSSRVVVDAVVDDVVDDDVVDVFEGEEGCAHAHRGVRWACAHALAAPSVLLEGGM